MIRGRPVRFLVAILGGWTALRVVMVLPMAAQMSGQTPLADAVQRQPDAPHGKASLRLPAMVQHRLVMLASPHVGRKAHVRPTEDDDTVDEESAPSVVGGGSSGAQSAFAQTPHLSSGLANFAPGVGLSPGEAGVPQGNQPGRWSGAAWMLWRNDDKSAGYARDPRLGGSQAGVRIDYALAPASPLRPALYGRLSSALQDPAAAEVAAGLAIHPPLPVPVTLAIERREAVTEGGRSAFAILAAGGINPVAIGHGFRLDGYAQAGLVGFRRKDGFADGRLTVERPVADMPLVALGAGLWGAAQPSASRLDIGPQASMRLRLSGTILRLGAEWRERIAGNATPASGPAMSLGTDF